MKIIVCLKEVIDPALNLDFGLTNKVIFREGLPLTLNPSDAAALAIALDLKSADNVSQSEIMLISIGPERVESYLRNGLALGADKAVRIHEEDAASLSPYRKARLLAGAASLLGADLIFTGARSLDTASGQVGLFIAARLGMPCVNEVVGLETDAGKKSLTVIRDIGRGEREKVLCPLPAVITVKGEGKLLYASLDKLIESKKSEITVISPEDIGISPAKLKSDPTRVTGLLFPRPAPRKVPPLDSSLPAFYRVLQLLEGGIARRKSLMLEGSGEEMAERLFELLKEEGILKSAAD
jgi:electron transfer flavoprotein beta subunit